MAHHQKSSTNIYKSISQRWRGFLNKTDIGYDSCSPLPFDSFTTSILCICATNLCNQNLGTCQSSVNSQLQTNTAPSLLSSIIPELEASISCFDTAYPSYSTSYCIDHLASPFIDISKCNAYTSANAVLCMMHICDGEIVPVAIMRDYYKLNLAGALNRVNRFNRDSNKRLSYNETLLSFYINFNVTELTLNNTQIQQILFKDTSALRTIVMRIYKLV